MADVLKNLGGTYTITTSSVAIYTAPAGTTTVIRNIHVVNTNVSVPVTFSMNFNNTAGAVTGALYFNHSVPSQSVFDWSGFLVVPANVSLFVSAGTSGSLVLSMSGVESA